MPTDLHTTIEERVAKGAALLDEKVPGWVNDINLTTLRLENVYQCVLGQEFGGYEIGARELGLDPWDSDAVEYGFMAEGHFGDPEADPWDDLTEAWTAYIEERLHDG